MWSHALGRRASVVFLASLLLGAPAQAQSDNASIPAKPSPHFWQAAGTIVATNGLLWFYNRHVQSRAWADVGTQSWWANLRGGFTWDDDAFGVNQVAHPYHGSLYFNAARGSGYDFWGSTPFVAAGSLSWEFFTENIRPSINDLINTTLGGIALGEAAFRISSLLTSTRAGTAGRQVSAFVVDPISRTQSLLSGNDRSLRTAPSSYTSIALGQRRGVGTAPAGLTTGRPFVGLAVQYGNAFDEQTTHPYDAFEFSLHLSPNEHILLTHVAVSGLLARRYLARSSQSQLMLGLYQNYDYDDLPLTKASSQSMSGALLFRGDRGGRTQIDLGLHLELVPLAAVSSDYDVVRRRDYDFGPGVGGRFTGALRHDGRELVRLDGRSVWVHSLYGTDANHLMTTGRVSATVPVIRMLSVGGDLEVTLRRSSYHHQPGISRRVSQLRAYLIWSPS